MKEKIKTLTELQEIDLRIRALDEGMAKGPAEIKKREESIADRKATMAELTEKSEGMAKRRRELEAEVADELARIKDRQSKLMQVQANREYQSLLKEIEDGKKTNRAREEEVLQLIDEGERLQTAIAEETNMVLAEEKLLEEESTRIRQEAGAAEAEKNSIEEERQAKAKEVMPQLLSKYEILRQRRNGMAVVGVIRGVCQGCFMNIPPQLFNDLMAGKSLVGCPNCQRILYYQDDREKA